MLEPHKRERAVALRYDQKDQKAPVVVAKGQGSVAEKIKMVAQLYGIPMYQDDLLVEMLAQIEIEREIPVELYSAVAEILSWIYKANDTISKESV